MTTKRIRTSDILGSNYYTYELSSSNYTPALNDTITITCNCKNVYGDNIANKTLTLYQNGTNISTETTNSSGVATWSITCSTAGIQSFKVGNKVIEVFVDNESDTDHNHELYEKKYIDRTTNTPYRTNTYERWDEETQQYYQMTIYDYLELYGREMEFSIENFGELTGNTSLIQIYINYDYYIFIKEMSNGDGLWFYTYDSNGSLWDTLALVNDCNFSEVAYKQITTEEPEIGISKNAEIKVNVNSNRIIFNVYENNVLTNTIRIFLNDEEYVYNIDTTIGSVNFEGFVITDKVSYLEPKIITIIDDDWTPYYNLGRYGKVNYNVTFNEDGQDFSIDELNIHITYYNNVIYDGDYTDDQPIKQGNEIDIEVLINNQDGIIILSEDVIKLSSIPRNVSIDGSYQTLNVIYTIDEVGNRATEEQINQLWASMDFKEIKNNKITQWSNSPSDTKYPSEKLAIDTFEKASRKSNDIKNNISNTKYPTNRAVYNLLNEKIDNTYDKNLIYESDMTVDDNNWVQSGGNLTVSYDNNGCSVLGTEANDSFYKLNIEIPYDFICEFDIISMTEGTYSESTDFIVGNIDIRLQDNSLRIGQLEGGTDYTSTLPSYPINIKVEYVSTEAKVYVNDVIVGTWEKSYSYIGFKSYIDRNMTIKNLKIYCSDDDWNVNTILNKDLYVGTLRSGWISGSNVTITDNELNFTTNNLYNTYWFVQNYIFSKYDDWDLSFNIRKPAGSYGGRDFSVIIGNENNYIEMFMGYYDLVIRINGTEISKRSGGVNATSDIPIKISRRKNEWEFNYNDGEYIANVSTEGYDIINKFIVEDMNWSRSGSIFINNVVFESIGEFSIFDLIYPVGSIYMSVSNTSPSILFGGTWEQLQNRFLIGAGDTYSNGATGGAETVTLTTNQIPSHSHQTGYRSIYASNGTATALLGYSNASSDGTSSTSLTGGGQSHDNMPPYLAVYIWKRTA